MCVCARTCVFAHVRFKSLWRLLVPPLCSDVCPYIAPYIGCVCMCYAGLYIGVYTGSTWGLYGVYGPYIAPYIGCVCPYHYAYSYIPEHNDTDTHIYI